MSMRRHRKLIWWLLPLFALRGLVPAGFMLETSGDGIAIVVCPGHMPAMQGTSQGEQQRGGEESTGAPTAQSTNKLCPFAVAAGAAPSSFVAGVVSSVAHALDGVAQPSVRIHSYKALSAHLIRGPPALS